MLYDSSGNCLKWSSGNDSGGGTGGAPGGGTGGSGGGGYPNTGESIAVADFTFIVYAGGLVGFTNTSLGLIQTYSWNLGDGWRVASRDVLHQYVGAGTFSVVLTVANSAGRSSKTLDVTIEAAPIVETVDFTYATGALGVQFTDTSTKAGTRNWDFGDGTTSTEIDLYKLYDTPGIYTVTLTISGTSRAYQVSVDYGIILNWQDNSSTETGFKIEHSLDGVTGWTVIATVGSGVTTMTVTKNLHGVDPAVENHFRVYAYSGDGNSGYSNVVETLCEA